MKCLHFRLHGAAHTPEHAQRNPSYSSSWSCTHSRFLWKQRDNGPCSGSYPNPQALLIRVARLPGLLLCDVLGRTERGFSLTYDSLGKTLHTAQPQSPYLLNGLKLLYLLSMGSGAPLRGKGLFLLWLVVFCFWLNDRPAASYGYSHLTNSFCQHSCGFVWGHRSPEADSRLSAVL